ncbi:MAG TPA: hypothetical protein VGS20_13845 [Candidatus Acidoferrales bacterium]|nr:hypothetical protein [Candidatus Acidoferrales bacterium]
MNATSEMERRLLRHTVATLAYRVGKALGNAPASFPRFRAVPGSRTPEEILAHMGDLFDWALALADGKHAWHDSKPLPWDQEVSRFFTALEAFDRRLASDAKLGFPAGKLFQGPIADALTHTGQLALLRRLAGAPIRGENYFRAEIAAGRAGRQQAAPVQEFD